MAYRRPARKASTRRTAVRRSTRTVRSTRTRRAPARRRASASRSPQTVRIVIEQPAASGVTRPLVAGQPKESPRTNKF